MVKGAYSSRPRFLSTVLTIFFSWAKAHKCHCWDNLNNCQIVQLQVIQSVSFVIIILVCAQSFPKPVHVRFRGKNVSFSENLAYVQNGWSSHEIHWEVLLTKTKDRKIKLEKVRLKKVKKCSQTNSYKITYIHEVQ